MKIIALIILLILICSGLTAQIKVTGIITNHQGQPLPGVSIYLEGTFDGTTSDVEGQYTLTTAETGTFNLKVESMGFESQSDSIHLGNSALQKNFKLKESYSYLNEVTISAGAFEAGDTKRSASLTLMDIASMAGAMGDIVSALNTLPGTTRVGESGRLFVRGGDSHESKIFIDGLLVPVAYYSALPNLATRGRFNPFLFSGTTFSTGGYSAEYGQSLSSVLLLNTTETNSTDELNISLLSLAADITGSTYWDKGSATASMTYANLGPYMSVTKNNFEWSQSPQFFSNEISIKQKTGNHGMLKFYSNMSSNKSSVTQNDLDNIGEKITFDLKNQNYFFNTSWKNMLGEKWNIQTGSSFTYNQDNIDIRQTKGSSQTTAGHIKNVLTHYYNDQIEIKLGTELITENNEQTFGPHTEQFLDNIFGSFAEASIYTRLKWVIRPGVRYEYSSLIRTYNISPRFTAAYVFTRNTQLSFAYGQFYQLPDKPHLFNNTTGIGFEKANHYIVNFQTSKANRTFRAEAYYKKYDKLIKFETQNDLPQNYSTNGDGYAYGLDLFLRDNKTIKNGHYWISYSYLSTERNYLNFPKKTVPGFASQHNVSIVYKQWISSLKSQVGTDFSFTTPRPYNDPNKSDFNSGRTKPYHSLNVNWVYLLKTNLIFYTAVTNVLGTKNQFGHRFSTKPDINGVYAREPIVPFANQFFVLGVFITFSKDKTKNQLDKIN